MRMRHDGTDDDETLDTRSNAKEPSMPHNDARHHAARHHAAMRRRRRWIIERQRRERLRLDLRRRFAEAMALGAALCLVLAVVRAPYALASEHSDAAPYSAAAEHSATATHSACTPSLTWPLDDPAIADPFDAPPQPWLAGHRGIDLAASPGTPIASPAAGTVAYAGLVAGKQVVSIRHGERTSTFEPAVTDLAVGAAVTRGQLVASVAHSGDHCHGECLHWGVKTGERDYLDPAALAGAHRIVLKRVQ